MTKKNIAYNSKYFNKPIEVSLANKNLRYQPKQIKRKLNPKQKGAIESFKKWMIQNRYSENTIRTYINMMETFLGFYCEKDIKEIELADISTFNYEYIIQQGYSNTYQNQMVNAIKLFYQKMYDIGLDIEKIERPRKNKIITQSYSKRRCKTDA